VRSGSRYAGQYLAGRYKMQTVTIYMEFAKNVVMNHGSLACNFIIKIMIMYFMKRNI
jgi:hypothetical protein